MSRRTLSLPRINERFPFPPQDRIVGYVSNPARKRVYLVDPTCVGVNPGSPTDCTGACPRYVPAYDRTDGTPVSASCRPSTRRQAGQLYPVAEARALRTRLKQQYPNTRWGLRSARAPLTEEDYLAAVTAGGNYAAARQALREQLRGAAGRAPSTTTTTTTTSSRSRSNNRGGATSSPNSALRAALAAQAGATNQRRLAVQLKRAGQAEDPNVIANLFQRYYDEHPGEQVLSYDEYLAANPDI